MVLIFGGYLVFAAFVAYIAWVEIATDVVGIVLGLLFVGGGFVWRFAIAPARHFQQSLRNRMLPLVFGFVDGVKYGHGEEPHFMRTMPGKELVQRVARNVVRPWCRFVVLTAPRSDEVRDACKLDADERRPIPIYAVLGNHADAEDVTQATFLNAYRALERGERPRPLDSWLIAIAHKLCDQRARQEARRERVAYEDQSHEAVPEDDGPSPSDVSRGLRRLPFDQRAALIMREVEGRGYPELAHIFGITIGDVETLLFRARRALREELEGGLTCHLAERAISRRLDGLLGRAERRHLRGHLRDCRDCSRFARSQRAQRAALRALADVPLPDSLASFFGQAPQSSGLSSRA